MSDIVVHPLTAVNGVPVYSADDYRHVVNPFLSPSNKTPFESLQGVRAGIESPLCSIDGLTVTVKPHCGLVCPWYGAGSYTYAITEPMSVKVPDLTGDYKIVVAVYDPSLSHGDTPGAWLQSWPASTPNSEINGLVLATVKAGVISDVEPILRPVVTLEVHTSADLESIVPMEGQEAVTSVNNHRFRFISGIWRDLSYIPLPLGSDASGWDISYRCSMVSTVVTIEIKVTRKSDWVAKAWDRSQILTFPSFLKPTLGNVNVMGVGPTAGAFQWDPSGLYVRAVSGVTYHKGDWLSTSLSYSV